MQVFLFFTQKLAFVGQVGLVMQVFQFFYPETACIGTGGSSHAGVLETGGSRHAGVPV